MRVVVLADTHAPRRWKTCPPAVAACRTAPLGLLDIADGRLIQAQIVAVT